MVNAPDGMFAITVSGLPPGLTYSGSGNFIQGTPTTAGSYLATFTAKLSGVTVATQVTQFPVQAAAGWPAIGSPLIVNCTVGVPMTYQTLASHAPDAWTYASLPAGLSGDPSTGIIHGTPTGAGTTNATVTGTITSNGNFGTATITFIVASTATPGVSSRSINNAGATFSLGLDQSCTTGAGGNGGMTLSASGGPVTATYSSGSGSSTYVYSLNRTVAQTELVTATYTQPGAGIAATTGGIDLPSFSGSAVTNNSTQNPPTLSSATVASNGTTINLVFSASATTGTGGIGGVSLSVNGTSDTVTYNSGSGSATYVFTATTPILIGDVVTVSYVQPGAGIAGTSNSLDVASFSNSSVTNNSAQSAAAVVSNGILKVKLIPRAGL
jgi:Putative Ig domain